MNPSNQFVQPPVSIYIQINQKKKCCVQVDITQTAADLRALLVKRKVDLKKNVHFLDAKGYPVLLDDEKNINIDNLVTEDGMDNIVSLEADTKDGPTSYWMCKRDILLICFCLLAVSVAIINSNAEVSIKKPLCSWTENQDLDTVHQILRCSRDETSRNADYIEQNTTDYIGDNIIKNPSGQAVLMGHGSKMATATSKNNLNQAFLLMYKEWSDQREQLQADFKWYNNVKSNTGTCGGRFDERVANAFKVIKDTPEIIRRFTEGEFGSWPAIVRSKVDVENVTIGSITEDVDDLDMNKDGKISSNMYLVTWKRNDQEQVEIQTYVTIFERKVGKDCRLTEGFWSENRERIFNAKKYYLLLKIETNPVYRAYLLE